MTLSNMLSHPSEGLECPREEFHSFEQSRYSGPSWAIRVTPKLRMAMSISCLMTVHQLTLLPLSFALLSHVLARIPRMPYFLFLA